MNGKSVIDFPSFTKEGVIDGRIECIPRSHCPLCGKQGESLYTALADWVFGVPGSWGVRRCSVCDLAWQDPQPVPEDIPKLYGHYYTHNGIPETRLARLRRSAYRWALARRGWPVERPEGFLPWLLSLVPSVARSAVLEVMNLPASQVGSLLDVGCGNGDFIARMKAFGWNVSGVEPDPVAATRARSLGVQVFAGTIADVPTANRYDVITLSHVIEHVADPITLLRECATRLRPKTGILVLTTPNIKSLGHRWFRSYWRGLEMPRHLVLFSPASLSHFVARSGLVVRSIRTETRLARMIFIPSYCAQSGALGIGDWTDFGVGTKCASYAFQLLEDLIALFKKDIGEEIYCVSTAAAEENDEPE
jgi:2-polyprenyl-3-methyl-5-hydroxy-6-metoxy-1,4-benzoquinol methylase